MTTRRRRFVALIAGCAALAAGTAAVSAASPTPRDATPDDGAPVAAASILQEAFAVLRRQSVEADATAPLPPESALQSANVRETQAAAGDPRHIGPADSGLYVVPVAEDRVCVDEVGKPPMPRWGRSCGLARDAASGGMIAGFELAPGGFRLRGLVPDGVGTIVISSDGGTHTVPVVDNGYAVLIPDSPTRVTWKTDETMREVDLSAAVASITR